MKTEALAIEVIDGQRLITGEGPYGGENDPHLYFNVFIFDPMRPSLKKEQGGAQQIKSGPRRGLLMVFDGFQNWPNDVANVVKVGQALVCVVGECELYETAKVHIVGRAWHAAHV